MNYAEICIIKRDGKREDFSISKIKNAIGKAFQAGFLTYLSLKTPSRKWFCSGILFQLYENYSSGYCC